MSPPGMYFYSKTKEKLYLFFLAQTSSAYQST
jgi:hypothetical protein